jgi:acetate kinase
VLVVNTGSTGLKVSLVEGDEHVTMLDAVPHEAPDVVAVGHRIVFGGLRFVEPVLLDDATLDVLDALAEVAPLHNARATTAARSLMEVLPDVPHVGVFDTAFHASLPPPVTTLPVPAEWRAAGVRRYGFHGSSVAWSHERARALAPGHDARMVVCHLGGGCSVTAVRDGRSVDTTMGSSPTEGVPMPSRSGSLDPAVVLKALGRDDATPDALARLLATRSGLAAIAGTADIREIEAHADSGDDMALLALDIFDRGIAHAVAGMVTALGGLDAVVFTGGIGEGSPRRRTAIAARLSPFGVEVDAEVNAAEGDRDIAPGEARVRVLVITAREDIVIARAARGFT